MRAFSWLIGIVTTALLCLLLLKLLPFPFNIAAAIAVIGYPGIAGLIQIPIGFRGVPTLFGGRLMRPVLQEREVSRQRPDGTIAMVTEGVEVAEARFEFHEGWSWIPPRPIMAAETVDVREQSVKVDPFTVISKNDVRIIVQQSVIRYRTTNPAQYLSVTEGVIKQSLIELVQQGLRSFVVGLDDQEVIRKRDAIRDEVKRQVDAHDFEWGIDILQVLIGEFARPEAVQADYELRRREEQQRDAERIELDHVRERLKELIQIGFTLERAQEIVQTERKKVTKSIDEKRIIFPPEAIQVLGAILGRRT